MVNGQKYHILYKTICTVTGNFYIGVHSTTNIDDGYLGSGKRLNRSIQKHGKENHTREILEFFETKEELFKREREVVNDEILNENKCMNLKRGGEGGFHLVDRETVKRISVKGGKSYHKIKQFSRHRELLKTDQIYKKRFSEKISSSLKGSKNFWYVKTLSDETKRKIGEKNSQLQKGEKNSQFGTFWITNEKENKKIRKSDLIPVGWRKGRKMK